MANGISSEEACGPDVRPAEDESRRLRDLCELLDRERRARRKLAAMSATKDAVLAIIADETRSTLNSVADWMRLVGNHPLDSRTRELAFTAIERAARRELELLDDVLDVGRAERGEAHLDACEVDLDHLLGSAIDTVMRSEAGLRIECIGLGDDVALVVGERAKLERAFERLLSAAVRCTRRGAAVTVTLRREPRAISVRIEHPVRADLEPAVDADCCLRLSLARAVMHAHRGTLHACSDDARGVRTLVASMPASSDVTFVPKPLHDLRILVADPDDECRSLLGDIARENGASVMTALDASSARAAIAVFSPDVVLTSIDAETVLTRATPSAAVLVLDKMRASGGAQPRSGVLDLPFTSPRVVAAVASAIGREVK